jgi:hypothetical protein
LRVKFYVVAGGFAPRQLKRYVASLDNETMPEDWSLVMNYFFQIILPVIASFSCRSHFGEKLGECFPFDKLLQSDFPAT